MPADLASGSRRVFVESMISTIAALTVGFLSGLFAFKVKMRWCSVCGRTKTCPAEQAHLDSGNAGAAAGRRRRL
jgi:hypothetical protein